MLQRFARLLFEGNGQSMKALRVVAGLDASFGGAPVAAVEECLASQRAGIRTTLAFPCETPEASSIPDMADELLRGGVAIHGFRRAYAGRRWSRRWGFSPRFLPWLGRSVRSFDVVHFHGAWTFTTFAGSIVAKLAGRPIVLSPHETLTDFDVDKSGLVTHLLKRILRRGYLHWFDLVITASRLELNDSRRRVSRARFVALHHPVASRPDNAPQLNASDASRLRIGFLGRLDPKKNVDLLIRVLATLPEEVTLRIAGDGATGYSSWLRALAREYQVDERVEWLGFVDAEQKGRFFGSIDLLALPSAYECFGVAAAEAMLAGVPVLVSPQCGVAEIVMAGGGGFVSPASDDAASEILHSLFMDRSQLAAVAQLGAAFARNEFSGKTYGTRLKREYEILLTGRTPARSMPRAEQTDAEGE